MATSGSFSTSYVGNFYFTFEWYRTGYNSSANQHYIHYTLYAHNTAGNYRTVYLKNLTINGSQVFYTDGTSSSGKSYYNNDVVTSGDITISSSNSAGDGSLSASFEAGVGKYPGSNCSGSGSWALDRIPRYGTSNQSLNSKTETTIKMNWSSDNTVDYIWYSTNNGSNWAGVDVSDSTSGTYNITGLSPNTTYNIKTRCRRKDSQLTTDSSTLSVTTYKAPTNAFSSKTETSITMTWSCDSTVDYIWYSKDNGTNWTGLDVTDGTSGSYTISSLSANTSYNIKTRCRRKSTQTTYDCTKVAVTTYDYPHITAVGTADLVIGNQQTLTLYNPLSRSVTVKMYKDSTSGTQLYSGTTTTTSIKFTPTASTLYASIPSATSGKCVYSAIYGSVSTKTTTGAYTYKIIGTETPTFSTFTYKDTNTTVTGVTGNNQVLVKGLSTLQVTIASANKMVTKNSATGKSYNISIDTLNKDVNYSTSDIVSDIGTITSSGTKRLNVRAYDSRNLSTLAYKDITVYDYSKPVINATITRLNNFEAQTTIKVSGTYTKLAIDGTNKNSISSVKYRYRETNGTWSSWVTLTTTVSNGTYSCSDVILSLDNTKSFEFQLETVDKLQTTTSTSTLDIGQAIFFISTNKKACYINGEKILTAKEMYPVGAIYLSVNNTNPATLFGGTWEQIKDRFLLACGSTYSNGATGGASSVTSGASSGSTGAPSNNTSGASSGSTGAPSNNTSGSTAITTAQMPSHTHSFSATTGSAGAHTHGGVTKNGALGSYEFNRPNGWSGDYSRTFTDSAGAHTHSVSGTTGGSGSGNGHTHTLSSHTHSLNSHTHTLSSHTHSLNSHTHSVNTMPPYLAVYVWKRTA